MPTTVLRTADHRRMPWKNGGGETVEIMAWPPGAALDAFDWRISMATVARDSAFSLFDGVDRTLVVIDGEGLRLSIDGRPAVTLDCSSAPFAFAADVPTDATLVAGAITDLNVMTRRSRCRHAVSLVHGTGAPTPWQPDGAVVSLICLGPGNVRMAAGDDLEVLGPRDAWVCSGCAVRPWIVTAEPGTRWAVVVIDPLLPAPVGEADATPLSASGAEHPPAAAPELLATLRALELELHHPGVPCTRGRLEALLHPSFDEIGRSGRRYDRSTVIEVLAAQLQPPAVVSDDFDLRMLSAGWALLRYRSEHPAVGGGAPEAALRTSLWKRESVGWQLVHHQGTPVKRGPDG